MKNTNSYCNKGETMVNFTRKPRYGYEDLLEIIRLLRSPEGCPWDKVQTHASIRRGLLEEAYEAAEAIDLDDAGLLQEELGDVMMQVVFHADIEKDRGRFTMDDVVDGVVKKLLYRHPHVFGSAHEDSPESVLISWDQLKRAEKGQATTGEAMEAVARSLPGLWRAEKLQKRRRTRALIGRTSPERFQSWRRKSGSCARLWKRAGAWRRSWVTCCLPP